jgi:hypothetical protein
MLAAQIVSATTDEIELQGNVVIAVHSNSFRTVRGRTLLACVFDETAFWRDETTANPDVETFLAEHATKIRTFGKRVIARFRGLICIIVRFQVSQ